MKALVPRIFICSVFAFLAAATSFAGGRRTHSSSAPGFAARPVGRSNAGAQFHGAGVRHWNTAGNFRGVNYVNRNGVRWNNGSYRAGNARWNGNSNRQWTYNRSGNWNHNGNWHRHYGGNQVVFIGGGYYPWFFPYSYPYYNSYYPYSYGAYQPAYGYDSGDGYAQPVYQGNNVDPSYAPADDKGSYPDGSYNGSSNGSVADVQRLLARAGFYKGAIDGAMGSRTFYAIRAYQRSHNLQVDGQIGPQLLNSLSRS
jgi:hypothetical protein